MIVNYFELFKKKRLKQVASLYLSMIFGIVIGIAISVLNTRLLGSQQYGDLKFLQTLFIFFITLLTFGIFVTGGRLFTQRDYEKHEEHIIGNLFIYALGISLIFIISTVIFSFYQNKLFSNQLSRVIRICSPLLFVFPFQLCIDNILQGANRIYELSLFRIFPQILYLLLAISFNYFFPVDLIVSLFIQMISLVIIIMIMIIWLKPKFGMMSEISGIIWRENKSYGIPIYVGFITGVASSHIGVLLLGYFLDNVTVGYFSLAVTIAMPLTMLPNVVGTTFFKEFANLEKIPKKITRITILLTLAVLVGFLLLIKQIVVVLYSKEFLPVVSLAYLTSVGSVLHGFGDYINRFVSAHGGGKEIRNSNFAICFSNIVFNAVLVAWYGAFGASLTKVISGLIYLIWMKHSYNKISNNYKIHSSQ